MNCHENCYDNISTSKETSCQCGLKEHVSNTTLPFDFKNDHEHDSCEKVVCYNDVQCINGSCNCDHDYSDNDDQNLNRTLICDSLKTKKDDCLVSKTQACFQKSCSSSTSHHASVNPPAHSKITKGCILKATKTLRNDLLETTWIYESNHPYNANEACSYQFDCPLGSLKYRLLNIEIENEENACTWDKLTVKNSQWTKNICESNTKPM